MSSLFRSLITLLLALSLPVQGIAVAWQTCCKSGIPATVQMQPSTDALNQHLIQSHHHETQMDSTSQAAHPADADHNAANLHGCSHSASCCTAALASAHSMAISAVTPQSIWVAFQQAAPASHTPHISDPPPRSSRS
jgi:hypothetical protein